jgi:hypothetical protein
VQVSNLLETKAYSIGVGIASLLRARNDMIINWNVDTISPIPEGQRLEK